MNFNHKYFILITKIHESKLRFIMKVYSGLQLLTYNTLNARTNTKESGVTESYVT